MSASHAAVTDLLGSFERRRTSPELVRRHWNDLQLGPVSAIERAPTIAALLERPQELTPLLSQLSGDFARNGVFARFAPYAFSDAGAAQLVEQEQLDELIYRGLNYMSLLDALTLELDGNREARRALLFGRVAEIVSREIPYENFFTEAKCKAVYWALHLSGEGERELVSRRSAALLLHANIWMAILSESVGPKLAAAGRENAACGYLLAEEVAREGLDAISNDWRAIYRSWNAAFMLNSPCPNMDAAKIAATALLLPSLVGSRSPDAWLRRRALSLLLALISSFHPDSSLRVGSEVVDSVPLSNSTMRRWAKANRQAAREVGIAPPDAGGARSSEMTSLTRYARAMERFLEELRALDSATEITVKSAQRHAVGLASTWRKAAGL